MSNSAHRMLAAASLIATLAMTAGAATLEQLSIEQMAEKSTLIVRGRVTACAAEVRGPVIYTKCKLTVSEKWKGQAGSTLDFYNPGGSAQGLSQSFAGTPKFSAGDEYVLFLWAGRSGIHQVIGLSQGVFDLNVDAKGSAVARREASSTVILNAAGNPVQDTAVEMRVSELKRKVAVALSAEAKR